MTAGVTSGMTIRWLFLGLAVIAFLGAGLILWATTLDYEIDRVEVNRIARAIEANWPDALEGQLPESSVNYLFVQSGQSVSLHTAGQNVLAEVTVDAQIVGTIVVPNEGSERLDAMRTQMLTVFFALLLGLVLLVSFFALYLYWTILRPFRKLESFAAKVAQGDLSIPLEMDKKNRFGAFTESFDLMREQLALARENERLANISKKELVASLSHDIKTPVASIKVISELHQAKHGASPQMESIAGKADQIDLLISNMFSATLEELQQLEVSVGEVTSTELEKYIREADYQKRIHSFTLPECVVEADKLRLQQVIDNIIGNSYKYAGTDIEVSGCFEESFFVLTVRDFGPGVSAEEISLLCQKYYRAENSEDKDGAGLGLYLTQYFLDQMGGSLQLENCPPEEGGGLQAVLRMKI